MKIKQRPEDFSVRESFRFDPVDGGRFRVYLMDKQKLSTFDAVEKIRVRFGLRPAAISYCGLKDKQGRTEQLIAVDGAEVDLQEPNLRLKYMGRTDRPLSAANITSNRFSVTVRALSQDDFAKLNVSASEVNRLGVVNYFDSQRFGALKHGQGFIAKDLMRGDFEAALRNYMAKPSTLDRTEDAKVKRFWKENWRDWDAYCPYPSNNKYSRILRVLREDGDDFLRAFLQIDASYRAMMLFEYQSYLWNEGVRRLLQLSFSREDLFPMPYQAGTLLFHRNAEPAVRKWLRDLTFPLLSPHTEIDDPKIQQAVDWVLGKEKITLASLEIPDAKGKLFFKHEERPVLVFPDKLVLGRPGRDELNPGMGKLNVAFTLPPGAYATLVIKRLFHYAYQPETDVAPRAPVEADAVPEETPARLPGPRAKGAPERTPREQAPLRDARRTRETGAAPERKAERPGLSKALAKRKGTGRDEADAGPGFRAQQRAKKAAKQAARAATEKKRSRKTKG